MSSNKRIRLEQGASAMVEAPPSATMNALPSEVMKTIFTYVGKGNYCFIGPVSKDFCYNYLTMEIIEDKYAHKLDLVLAVNRNKVTTADAASSSMEFAEDCFLYAPDKFQEKLFRLAARNGRQDIVTMAVEISGIDRNDWINGEDLEEITKRGDLDMLLLLKEKGLNISLYHVIRSAALHGHLNIIRWLHQMKENISSNKDNLFTNAAKGGHMDVIQWGMNAGYACNKDSCINNAVASGNLQLVKWVRSQDISWNARTSSYAVRSGNIELLQYLHDNGCEFTSQAYNEAAQRVEKEKVLEIFKWLHQHNVPWDEATCLYAAVRGYLDVIIYAKTNGCPWDERTLSDAVKFSHFDVVRYCLENNCPIGDTDLYFTSMYSSNHEEALKLLKLFREFGIPWNERLCKWAAYYGNLDALKWARGEECPWDENTFRGAIQSNDIGIVQYCIDNHCPFSQDAYSEAVRCKDPIPMLKLLRSNGYEWDKNVCIEAACEGELKVLRWLRYHNCPWDEGVCNEAVRYDNYDILVYAHENKCPWTKETFAYCFDDDGLDGEFDEVPTEHTCSNEIMKYIRKHNCPKPRPTDWTIR